MAARSKASVCCLSSAEIVCSNPTGAWILVCFACCALSGRGLGDGRIAHPEESHRLWCVVVCDIETSQIRRPCPTVHSTTVLEMREIIKIVIYRV